jgi:hypothetical protein
MGSGVIGDVYRVVARNTAPDSGNRIHSDDTAARFGFRSDVSISSAGRYVMRVRHTAIWKPRPPA